MAQLSAGFELHGDVLSVEEAEPVKRAGEAQIDAATAPIEVELGGLHGGNSLTVAVLVAWHRHAHLQQKSIKFLNPSAELRAIIDFSGLTSVIATASGSDQP